MGTACVSQEICCSKQFYCMGSSEASARNIDSGVNVQEIRSGQTPGLGDVLLESGSRNLVELSSAVKIQLEDGSSYEGTLNKSTWKQHGYGT